MIKDVARSLRLSPEALAPNIMETPRRHAPNRYISVLLLDLHIHKYVSQPSTTTASPPVRIIPTYSSSSPVGWSKAFYNPTSSKIRHSPKTGCAIGSGRAGRLATLVVRPRPSARHADRERQGCVASNPLLFACGHMERKLARYSSCQGPTALLVAIWRTRRYPWPLARLKCLSLQHLAQTHGQRCAGSSHLMRF